MADDAANPERELAITYARPASRAGLRALFDLDESLAAVLRTTSEPALGQMRLVWWRDALMALDAASPPRMPVLEAIATEVIPHGVRGEALAEMISAWLLLIEQERFDEAALGAFAASRGGVLFDAAASVLGAESDPAAVAGRGWALVDLARHLRDPELSGEAIAVARPLLSQATRHRWSRNGRALGALTHLAELDGRLSAGEAPIIGSPRRVARMMWHRLTGR